MILRPEQIDLVQRSLDTTVFLEGPAGAGKTTVGVQRLLYLLARGQPAQSILVLTPQRTLAAPYLAAARQPDLPPGGRVGALTIGGLAQRMVELFWPLAAGPAGFAQPDQPPIFLTAETAQYYMARLVRPLRDEGRFQALAIDAHRLYAQTLDNLGKAASVGFSHTEIGRRLSAAWTGDPGQLNIFADVQVAADRFRAFCLAHNLLDFSLQLEVFWRQLWPLPLARGYLQETYRHLVADNLEEDIPLTHDLLAEWLPALDSAVLIYDHDAGYRRFLGADPDGAYGLRDLCAEQAGLLDTPECPPVLQDLGANLAAVWRQTEPPPLRGDPLAGALVAEGRFFPEMLDAVAEKVRGLVFDQGLPPGEVVVLTPYLSDALRFAVVERLRAAGLPARSHRPSRSLRDEPATQCLLTLAALAHPAWNWPVDAADVAYAFLQAIAGLDLARAHLLAQIVHRPKTSGLALSSFDQIAPEVRARITYRAGERYETLREWLAAYTQGPPLELDHFLARLFGEVLSQPGFGFHAAYDAAGVAANLVESARKFRWAAAAGLGSDEPLGREYLAVVADGVIAAQYLGAWREAQTEAVLVAPAYTFLLRNQSISAQVWLDVGSPGWFERLEQPLTHPYILSRQWPDGRRWTDADEEASSREALARLGLGLLRRCRGTVVLGLSRLSEQGYEQGGPLLRVLQQIARRRPAPEVEA